MAENNQTQSWNQSITNKENNTKNEQNQVLVFWEIQQDDKLLAKLTKGQRDNIQINKIRNGKGNITINTEDILNTYFKSL